MTTDGRPTIVLADDNALLLKRVSQLLAPSYNILAAVSNGVLAVEAVQRLDPDVAVLDIAMPGLDGFQTACGIRQNSRSTKLVFLTMYDDEEYVSFALESGVLGYVLKRLMHSDLIPAIEHALAGHIFVSAHPHRVTD
jgi:DNA-binding NarL/FixJ family response regulator